MLAFLLQLLLAIIGTALGAYILLAGRRALWATLGIVALVTVANLLAVLAASYEEGWDLLDNRQWLMLAIAAGAAALGVYLGRYREKLAIDLLGFIAGVDAALWFRAITTYAEDRARVLPEGFGLLLLLLVLVISGLVGLYLVRHFREEALILISMFIGVELISQALSLDTSRSFTAVILLSLALVGVVVQYATYLRVLKQQRAEPGAEPALPELLALEDWQKS